MSVPADLPAQVMNTKPLFKLMVERKASDLFFTCNAPVKIKIEGKIFPVNKQVLSPETVRQQLEANAKEWGFDTHLGVFHFGTLPRDLTERSLRLFANEVSPRLRHINEAPDAAGRPASALPLTG